jgi:hypothetical protein
MADSVGSKNFSSSGVKFRIAAKLCGVIEYLLEGELLFDLI